MKLPQTELPLCLSDDIVSDGARPAEGLYVGKLFKTRRKLALYRLQIAIGNNSLCGAQYLYRSYFFEPLAGHGVVRTYSFDGVAEKVYADGIFAVYRKNIEDIAAYSKATLCLHLVFTCVAHGNELRWQIYIVELRTYGELYVLSACREELHGRFCVAYYYANARIYPFCR